MRSFTYLVALLAIEETLLQSERREKLVKWCRVLHTNTTQRQCISLWIEYNPVINFRSVLV